jgi:hypothetical protein
LISGFVVFVVHPDVRRGTDGGASNILLGFGDSNLTEVRYVRPGGKANSSKPGLMLSERRFKEFDEFLFRNRPTIGEWADGASETAASQELSFEESHQVPPNIADCF